MEEACEEAACKKEACEKEEEEQEGGEEERPKVKDPVVEPEPEEGPPKSYTVMYYKKNNCIGLRQGYGLRRQFCSFGGKSCKMGEKELRKIAVRLVKLLEDGMLSEADAKAHAKSMVK